MTAIDMKQLREDVVAAHQELLDKLAEKRDDRDQLNAEIRGLVAQQLNAARAVRALTPKADRV